MSRVVILASSVDVLGGAQRVAHVLAEQLHGRGHPVDLIGIAPSGEPHDYGLPEGVRRLTLMREEWPPLPARYDENGRRAAPDAALAERRARLTAQAVEELDRVLRDGAPGVIISTQLWAMEHLAATPHDGWPVIGQYHSSIEAAASGADLQRIRDLYADADALAMLTPSDAAAMTRAGLNNVTWVPNPLAFWPTPADGSARVVTYLGRLSHEKGVAYLIAAWGQIAERHPEWRLRIVGSGPLESELRDQARPLGRVEFVAPVADAEATLRESGVLVLPSLTEGLPLALAEAMALGLPCVASDCSAGVRMLTGDGSAASLVPRGDASALAASLSALLSAPAERARLGRQARAAVAPYRADLVADRWEELIAAVLR